MCNLLKEDGDSAWPNCFIDFYIYTQLHLWKAGGDRKLHMCLDQFIKGTCVYWKK